VAFTIDAIYNMEDIGADKLGCLTHIGSYQICLATQRLSINGSLILLMVQAMLSRMLVPGMSIFLNASVRRSQTAQ
jgi:hypothetical protein